MSVVNSLLPLTNSHIWFPSYRGCWFGSSDGWAPHGWRHDGFANIPSFGIIKYLVI